VVRGIDAITLVVRRVLTNDVLKTQQDSENYIHVSIVMLEGLYESYQSGQHEIVVNHPWQILIFRATKRSTTATIDRTISKMLTAIT
jgi:hypothetical protein